MTPSRFCGTIQGYEACRYRDRVCVAVPSMSAAQAASRLAAPRPAQHRRRRRRSRRRTSSSSSAIISRRATTYRARLPPTRRRSSSIRWRRIFPRSWRGCTCGTIASTKPSSTAEQALKVAPANPEAHRVLGLIAAAKIDSRPPAAGRGGRRRARTPSSISKRRSRIRSAKPIRTRAARSPASICASPRTTKRFRFSSISSASSRHGSMDRASWPRRTRARAERPKRSICWTSRRLEDPSLLPTLADFYERQERWKDAANAYARALNRRAAQRGTEDAIRAGAPECGRTRQPRQSA